MKKDIEIPKVENVYLAAILEWNDDFQENCWYVYLINNNPQPLEHALLVSKAYGTIEGEMRQTAILRHSFKEVPAQDGVRIELLDNSVLVLNNQFMVTYFLENKMYDKTFTFRSNTINERALQDIPGTNKRGILLK